MEVSSIIDTLKQANLKKISVLGLLAAFLLANIWVKPALGDWPPDQKGENNVVFKEVEKVAKTMKIVVTAYSSTEAQTDDTPFITASNTLVRDGIIASNLLPFGTKVRFPELNPKKIYIVEDRLALKNSHKVDIWFPSVESALNFGVKVLTMEVLP
jgi:3D (Asp-Asp-Asp) domain-containing protein